MLCSSSSNDNDNDDEDDDDGVDVDYDVQSGDCQTTLFLSRPVASCSTLPNAAVVVENKEREKTEREPETLMTRTGSELLGWDKPRSSSTRAWYCTRTD